MNEKNIKAIERIKKEIEKIDKKENSIYFFVIDTEGVASGSLEYIYHLAKFAQCAGYNVAMIYQTDHKNDNFIGVESWLGSEYSSIPHYNLNKDKLETNASDVLFIPEIYAQVMAQTKNLPCKRIVIMQNFDYILSQMPFSAELSTYGVFDAISNTTTNAKLLTNVFPYVNVKVINPFIGKMFGDTPQPKKCIINVCSKSQEDIIRLVKQFYWKFPLLKWVSFRDMKNMSKVEFSNALREGFMTIWMDDNTSFGYSALEAIKSGNIVVAKIPNELQPWMVDGDNLTNACLWFDNINEIQGKIAALIRAWITDKVPTNFFADKDAILEQYSEDKTNKEFIEYLANTINARKTELNHLITIAEKDETNE